eukprot:TRINITY_DN2207_c0_g1_i1.p1 TRINITY_DN2207_c0_g1~~TRINITY_DN2207_c0_g1_i1.p1  ORF type:complete len:189 (-),score=40.84 TRINITY_DN2207_c0_g1_i1:192-758(-)
MDHVLKEAPHNVYETKIADGIYFTDYRKQKNSSSQEDLQNLSKCWKKSDYEPVKHPEILAADYKEFQIKITKLKESIDEIMEVENYEKDPDFVDAIDEDYKLIIKYTDYQIMILKEIQTLDYKSAFLKDKSVADHLKRIDEVKADLDAFEIKVGRKPLATQMINEVQPATQPPTEEGGSKDGDGTLYL